MLHVQCTINLPLHREYSHEFLRPIDVEIVHRDDNDNPTVLGRMSIDRLDRWAAHEAGESLFDICDEDSQGWLEAYSALIGDDGEVRPSLRNMDEAWDYILFIHKGTFRLFSAKGVYSPDAGAPKCRCIHARDF